MAAVILNRVKSASFPNTISGVIFQPGAFTAVADGQIWLTPNESTKKAVKDALNGWIRQAVVSIILTRKRQHPNGFGAGTQVKTIGKHIFCK